MNEGENNSNYSNNFESQNNQLNNNVQNFLGEKPPIENNFNNQSKKRKPILLIIVICLIVVIAGIFLFTKMANNKGEKLSSNKNNPINKFGEVKEIKNTSKKIDIFSDTDYFEIDNEDGTKIVIDSKGKQLVPIEGYYSTEKIISLENDYFIYMYENENGLFNALLVYNGKVIHDFKVNNLLHYCDDYFRYKDGIIYWIDLREKQLKAYDIKNNKELWKYEGVSSAGFGTDKIDDGFIRIMTDIKPNYNNEDPNTILDFNGNKIVSGDDLKGFDEKKWLDQYIYTSKSNSYIIDKTHRDNIYSDEIDVYDFDNNLKAKITENDKYEYNLKKLLYSGVFIVEEVNKDDNDKRKDILYNEQGEALLTADKITPASYKTESEFEISYPLPKNMDIVSATNMDSEHTYKKPTYYLIKDGKIVKSFEGLIKHSWGNGKEKQYIGFSIKDKEDPTKSSTVIINLNNMKELNTEIKYETVDPKRYYPKTNIVDYDSTGKYVIIITPTEDKKEYEYLVYDSDFNLKYKSTDILSSVNDKYVFAYNYNSEGIMAAKLINIETGKEQEIKNIKGKFYRNNSAGFITRDGDYYSGFTNYYLYSFK